MSVTDTGNISDSTLIRRIRNGERGQYNMLISRHYNRVWCYIRYKTGDAELAYDLTQEAFLRTVKAIDSNTYDDRLAFGAFVTRIAHNIMVDDIRSRRAMTDIDELTKVAENADGENTIVIRDAVDRALSKLPREQRETVILAFMDGYTSREIAAITGELQPTVKSRLYLGREKLKIYLREEGFD